MAGAVVGSMSATGMWSEWGGPRLCRYWQGFVGKAAMYGSDNHSPTLFDSGAGAWNLGALDTILRRRIRKVMPGGDGLDLGLEELFIRRIYDCIRLRVEHS